jgi:hypothetical protein
VFDFKNAYQPYRSADYLGDNKSIELIDEYRLGAICYKNCIDLLKYGEKKAIEFIVKCEVEGSKIVKMETNANFEKMLE